MAEKERKEKGCLLDDADEVVEEVDVLVLVVRVPPPRVCDHLTRQIQLRQRQPEEATTTPGSPDEATRSVHRKKKCSMQRKL